MAYTSSPSLAVNITDPTGHATGPLELAFVDRTAVYATTDDGPITYRGKPYNVHVHVRRDEHDAWYAKHDTILKAGTITEPAAPTYRKAMIEAVLATVAEHWTIDLAHEAHIAARKRELASVHNRMAPLRKELAELEQEETELRDALRAAGTEPD